MFLLLFECGTMSRQTGRFTLRVGGRKLAQNGALRGGTGWLYMYKITLPKLQHSRKPALTFKTPASGEFFFQSPPQNISFCAKNGPIQSLKGLVSCLNHQGAPLSPQFCLTHVIATREPFSFKFQLPKKTFSDATFAVIFREPT